MATLPTSTTTPTLADIATAQSATTIFAFDRHSAAQQLARLQKLYAHRLAQLDTLAYLFDEGAPEITVGGETQHLTLRLGVAANEVYPVLREALDNALLQLEKEIVAAHQAVAQYAQDLVTDYAEKTDYAPLISALCVPAGPPAMRIAAKQPTARAQAA